MDTIWGTLLGAIVGSVLIIINEWVKTYFEDRKEKKKFDIWNELKQTDITPPIMNDKKLSEATKINIKEISSLLYEMVREGTIHEGPSSTFKRYKFNR